MEVRNEQYRECGLCRRGKWKGRERGRGVTPSISGSTIERALLNLSLKLCTSWHAAAAVQFRASETASCFQVGPTLAFIDFCHEKKE